MEFSAGGAQQELCAGLGFHTDNIVESAGICVMLDANEIIERTGSMDVAGEGNAVTAGKAGLRQSAAVTAVRAENVTKIFGNGDDQVVALDSVSVDIRRTSSSRCSARRAAARPLVAPDCRF